MPTHQELLTSAGPSQEFPFQVDIAVGDVAKGLGEIAWNNRRNIFIGIPVGAAIGLLKGNMVLAAGGDDAVEEVHQGATTDVGSYIALGIAAGAGILAGVGNGIRVYHSERQSIHQLEEDHDSQVEKINQYNRADENVFMKQYTLKSIQEGSAPQNEVEAVEFQEKAANYAEERMAGKAQAISKMIEDLDNMKKAISRRKSFMLITVPGETAQAFLGTSGVFAVGYYVSKGLLQDFLGEDPALRSLAINAAGGTALVVGNMIKSIFQVESPSGARGARVQDAFSMLQNVGILQKEEKKKRPTLEVARNGKQPKVKVSVKQ